tara:strand:- start:1018 stop:1812 length:795 start_codon:yes stop_codon:yes gene_type:complete
MLRKKIHFLCSLPRSGNTIFGALLNSTNKMLATPNSLTPEIVYQLHLLKNHELFINFPNHKSLDYLISEALQLYYRDWNKEVILDRGPWGVRDNLLLSKKINKNCKYIILHRPFLECLASMVKISKPDNVENYCDLLMQDDGIFGKNLNSIINLINSNNKFKIVHYKKLTSNPIKELNSVLKYLNIKNNIKKIKLKDFNINGIKYNDSYLGVDMHKIGLDIKLAKQYSKINIESCLSKKIINKYKEIDIFLQEKIYGKRNTFSN